MVIDARSSRWALVVGLCVVLGGGCGDDGAGTGETADEAESSASPPADATGTAPPPGPSAEGWEMAYVDGGTGLSCEQSLDAMRQAGAPALEIGGSTLVVGFRQLGDNQDPVVARFDGDALVWCQHHETEGPDGRAVGITWDGGDVAYVVYTIVGGGSSLEGRGGWIESYAPGSISGGGPKVSYVGRVAVDDGTLSAGTFIIAVKSDNEVNSHGPAGAVVVQPDGNVRFSGGSAHKPIDEGLVAMDCTDYPFDSTYVLSPDLSTMICAECTNCTSQRPCP